MILLAFYQFLGTMHLKSLSEPGFVRETLKNVTVPEGRDVLLSCTVKNLDGHKVRMNFHLQITIYFIASVIVEKMYKYIYLDINRNFTI